MNIRNESETARGACRLRIEGEMTIYTAVEHKAALLDRLNACDELELDLSAVGELDSAGLQLLLVLKREADAQGRMLRLVQHSRALVEVWELLNMQAHFGDPVVIPAEWRKQ
jgi:anti-sigma B factor antagonist